VVPHCVVPHCGARLINDLHQALGLISRRYGLVGGICEGLLGCVELFGGLEQLVLRVASVISGG
jgi:hypothetical protein